MASIHATLMGDSMGYNWDVDDYWFHNIPVVDIMLYQLVS